jgi:hypothetical protein
MSTGTAEATAWLGRVQHDLVKRLLWPARDRRDLGGAVVPGELRVTLTGDDGAVISAAALWQQLQADAPAAVEREALADFAGAVDRAVRAGAAGDLEGVLALGPAFDVLAKLARIVKKPTGGG